jgi:hypothetical protein
MYEIIEIRFIEVFDYLNCNLPVVHPSECVLNNISIANCLKLHITYCRQIDCSFNAHVMQWLERRCGFESHCGICGCRGPLDETVKVEVPCRSKRHPLLKP